MLGGKFEELLIILVIILVLFGAMMIQTKNQLKLAQTKNQPR